MQRVIGLVIIIFVFQICSAFAAEGYQPLAPIPSLGGGSAGGASDGDIAGYLRNLYSFGVAAAAGLAVIMVIWGGIQYITSVSGEGKGGGRDRITSAILGLLLALGSYIILSTINKDLLELDFEFKPEPLSFSPTIAPIYNINQNGTIQSNASQMLYGIPQGNAVPSYIDMTGVPNSVGTGGTITTTPGL